MCSKSRGLQFPQVNFTKNVKKCYRFEQAVVRGGCAASDLLSGVVRPVSWSGFGRGMLLSTMVCLVESEVASIDGNGAVAVGGGSRWFGVFSGDLNQCMRKSI